MVQNGALKNQLFWPCGPLVRTCAIYCPKLCPQELPILTMWASSADMFDLWSKWCSQESPILTIWASSADMSNSWSKIVLSRITYFDHVGLYCGHVRFIVQNGALKKHLFWPCRPLVRTGVIHGPKWCSQKSPILTMWASSADMCDLWSKMVLSRITYFDHVGL